MTSATLPTGVVTFLFTDIEGSTKLWERGPDAMREALADHDAMLRRVAEHHNGVVFKTVGDASFCAFQRPLDAVVAAIEAQRALHSAAWPSDIGEIRVRMAIHSGECAQRDGDYFGPAVNRVARLAAIAFGRQILVSAATAALVRDVLDERAIALRDLGASRLKDLRQPEPTYQVVAEGLRSDFPALTSLDSLPNNLPSQISSFVDRTNELEELRSALVQCRLLTITGPGGIGKTRLAVQLAAEIVERYPHGVWFVDLTPVQRTEFVAQTIAMAVNVQELPSEPIEKTLIAYFGSKTTLLLIDNSEQVLAGVARLARLILSQCPAVTILTTSREPLHLAGETIFRVGPPMDGGTRLFLERARSAAPSQNFGEADLPDIASLCKKLEGIPLAIELACARLSSMPLKQLARRLTSGLTLSSKDPTENLRHRTLRETIAWSYKLLSPDERSVLKTLAAFRGGCSAEALREVADHVADVEDAAGSLVDKSLLQLDDTGEDERYRLLDVVREYAYEQLDAADAESIARRHAAYYSKLSTAPYTAIDNDLPNIRAALEWAIEQDTAGAAKLVHCLAPYWRTRGLLTEARSWTSLTLAAIAANREDRASLLCLAASFASLQDELTESLRLSNEALDLYRALGDGAGVAHALFRTAEAVHRQGHLDRAEALYREALDGFSKFNEATGEMLCLGNLGMLARQRGDLHQASELLEDARRRAADLGEQRIGGEFVIAMGWVQLGLNDLEQSRRLFQRAFAQKSDAQDRYGVCAARQGLATVALKEGNLEEALAEFLATLDAANELQVKDYVARAFHGLAAILALEGANELAARFLGLADRLFEESGRELRDSIAYEIAARSLEATLPEQKRSALREEGARMHVADALGELKAAGERRKQST
jgi:predicted ATPase/class 3 adenylate cyclase